MQFIVHSHRNAMEIIESTPELKNLWSEIEYAVASVTESILLEDYAEKVRVKQALNDSPPKSLSYSINDLLDYRLVSQGWEPQSALFNQPPYTNRNDKRWRLDFSKSAPLSDESARSINTSQKLTGIAVEVAFNHGEAIAWNLLKPVMAAELNHVEKAIDIGEGIGVIITASEALKKSGGFDGAVGEFEKVLRYLAPMRNQLSTPMLILGLLPPRSFRLEKLKGKRPSRIITL